MGNLQNLNAVAAQYQAQQNPTIANQKATMAQEAASGAQDGGASEAPSGPCPTCGQPQTSMSNPVQGAAATPGVDDSVPSFGNIA
jgi:hypothetical protein